MGGTLLGVAPPAARVDNPPVSATRARLKLICALALAGASVPATAAEPPPLPVLIRLNPYAGRLVTVPIVIEKRTLTFLLDTGGGQTLITPRVASLIGCTPTGRSVGFRMNGERVEFKHCGATRLEIGGLAFARSQIAVWDVMAVLPKELPPLDGVLALDLFEQQPFSLDLASGTLTLESPAAMRERTHGGNRVKARIATGTSGAELTLFLYGRLNEPGWFLFDSANLDLVQAAPHLVRPSGPLPRQVEGAPFALDGLPGRSLPIRVRDLIHDGALSESFLRGWIWTIDLPRRQVWAHPLTTRLGTSRT